VAALVDINVAAMSLAHEFEFGLDLILDGLERRLP